MSDLPTADPYELIDREHRIEQLATAGRTLAEQAWERADLAPDRQRAYLHAAAQVHEFLQAYVAEQVTEAQARVFWRCAAHGGVFTASTMRVDGLTYVADELVRLGWLSHGGGGDQVEYYAVRAYTDARVVDVEIGGTGLRVDLDNPRDVLSLIIFAMEVDEVPLHIAGPDTMTWELSDTVTMTVRLLNPGYYAVDELPRYRVDELVTKEA